MLSSNNGITFAVSGLDAKSLLIVDNSGSKFRTIALKPSSIIPTIFALYIFKGIIEAGEKTGRLSDVFCELEERLKTMYEERVNILITVLEPAMIIFMGLIVGSVVVVMLLSMVSVSDINF